MTFIFFFYLHISSLSDAHDLAYEFGGRIIEQPTYRLLKEDYLLNPDQKILDFSPWRNRLYLDINLNLKSEGIKFISKFRPTISSDEKTTEMQTIIDDAYLDMSVKEKYFFYLGKKNVRDGVGLGANPTDFLGEGKEVDTTKREEERRVEREGNYLVGMDVFYKDITFTAIFAPNLQNLQKEDDRFLLKANILIESINTDMSFHYFNGTIPGAGFNMSTTIGESLVLHTETAFRWGSNRRLIKLIRGGTPNIYEINDPDDSQVVYPHIVAGGHWTFKDGTNIILEYIYNGDGYNDEEWNRLTGFIKYSYAEYKKGFLIDLMNANLLQANSIMTFRQLRQNYLFARLSNPEVYGKIDAAMVIFLNADDKSFIIYPSLNYELKKDTTVEVSTIIFGGANDTEFGMAHWDSEVSLIWKYFF